MPNLFKNSFKVVDFNIGSLKAKHRTYFYQEIRYDSYMKFEFIRCDSALVVAKPIVLSQFIQTVIEQLKKLVGLVHNQIMIDFPSFDLLTDEIYDDNNEKLVPEVDTLPLKTIQATELLI